VVFGRNVQRQECKAGDKTWPDRLTLVLVQSALAAWERLVVLYFQGDVCIELVDPSETLAQVSPHQAEGPHVLAWGELTGHRHAAYGDVKFVRQPRGLAGELAALYLGHLIVGDAGAIVRHEEHAPIPLAKGVYRVRRQREFDESLARGHGGRLVGD
jgi:hypothetical protein